MIEEENTVEVEVTELASADDYSGTYIPITEFRAALEKAVRSIPEQFRDNAHIRVRATGEYAYAYVEITFTRPETDGEVAAREETHRRWAAEAAARERREYERLRDKYGR